MLSLFQRKRAAPTAGAPTTPPLEAPKGLLRPQSAAALLATPRRQRLLEHIWQRTSLSRRQFATLYLAPLERYPDLWAALLYVLAGQYEQAGILGELVVQADQASVAQELGGDPTKAMAAPKHALQRKLLDGLRYLLREEFKLNQPQASDGWLTQDALWLVSKTVSDKLRAYLLSQGIDGIPSSNTAVFNVLQDHGIALPTPNGKAIWRATVTSDAGWSHSFTFLKLSPTLIWESAERPTPFVGSVQLDVEQDDATAPASPQAPPAGIEPGNTGTPSASPIPSATLAGASGVDALLDLLDLAPVSAAPPSAATMPAPAPAPLAQAPTQVPSLASDPGPHSPDRLAPSGEHFMAWLRQGIQARKLVINDAKALVHTVSGSAYLVSPGVFQRYAQEHVQVATLARQESVEGWQWVQKRFEKLRQHRKQPSGLNIWTCEVTGPRKTKRLYGYLLGNSTALFQDLPPDNPFLSLVKENLTHETPNSGTTNNA